MPERSLFLIFHGFDSYNIGIRKKILSQVKALSHCGFHVDLCFLAVDKNGFHKRMINNEVLENYGKGILAKIRKRICYSKLTSYILEQNVRFLYIRSFHNANPFLILMLRKLKHHGVMTVMEIPTFPYDSEYRNVRLSDRPGIFIDKVLRKGMAKHIFRIVTFSSDKFIFGRPTINISNAVDFDEINVKSPKQKENGIIRLIGVAEIHFWHGFDRIITGMAEYYKKHQPVNVFFDIVGEGTPSEMARLKLITNTNMLKEYVSFHGTKTGDDLDLLFEKADVGVASLGRHRSNITSMKSLKNREYAARGIPFVYSETDQDFDDMPYVLKVPANESPVDIQKIISFFYTHDFKPINIRNTIKNTLSWYVQMRKVTDIFQTKNPSLKCHE